METLVRRKTKIICTLGPASCAKAVIADLVESGMDVARLNFSHGSAEEHRSLAQHVRQIAQERNRSVALLQDLQGPKIRLGTMQPGTRLDSGTDFALVSDASIVGDESVASVDEPDLWRWVSPGDEILLSDGLLELSVQQVSLGRIQTRVVVGGELASHKGVHVSALRIPAGELSQKDRDDLRLGCELGVDFVAISFVRTAEDVRAVKAHIQSLWGRDAVLPGVIAKIEKAEAIDNVDAILAESTGIMVARGDLGVELGPEKVPLVQKDLIRRANQAGKLVITATEMLESMTAQSRPTRAEASDVANALLDGTDAVMLSGETARGAHPALVVQTMACILVEVERSALYLDAKHAIPQVRNHSNAMAHAAFVAADWIQADSILVLDTNQQIAKMLSDYRPRATIVAISGSSALARQNALYWGVEAITTPWTTVAEVSQSIRGLSASKHVVLFFDGHSYQMHLWP